MISLNQSPVPHLQTVEEFDTFIKDYYIPLAPEKVMEIGSFYGATLWSFIKNNPNLKQLISLDLPIPPSDGRYVEMLKSRAQWREWAQHLDFHNIMSDSHSQDTKTKILTHIDGKLDFLFIDGDHSYEGVKLDWLMYKDLVRPGGMIGFHDSVGYDTVKRLCSEIATEYKTELINIKNGWGITVVYV